MSVLDPTRLVSRIVAFKTRMEVDNAMQEDEERRKKMLAESLRQKMSIRQQTIASGNLVNPIAPVTNLSPREQLMYETLHPEQSSMAYARTAELPPPQMPDLRMQALAEAAKGGTFRARSPLTQIPGWQNVPSVLRNPAEFVVNAQNIPLLVMPGAGMQAKAITQMAGGQLVGGAIGQPFGEQAENILGTVGMLAGPFAPAAARKGVALADAMLPVAKIAAERAGAVGREALVGGEAGGIKLPFGRKAAVAEVVPGVSRPPAEEKMLQMLQQATKAKPEYAATLHTKRVGVARQIADIRAQEQAGALTRVDADIAVASARKGVIEAKYEFPPELVPTVDEVAQLQGTINSADLLPNDWTNAHAAFVDLLSGEHIQPAKIKLLGKIFGPEFEKATADLMADNTMRQLYKEALDAANIPRTLFSSYDISFPLRQGGGLIAEGEWWRSWKPMMKSLRESDAKALYDEILVDPMWEKYGKASDLAIADPLGGTIAKTQEQFVFRDTLASRAVKKVPGVKQSQYAYTTFGNKVRWGTFKKYVRMMEDNTAREVKAINARLEAGKITAEDAQKLTNKAQFTQDDVNRVANVTNLFSGWGRLGSLEKVLPELSQILFSPRFWASQIERVPYGIYAAIRTPELRGMVARNLGTFIGANVGLLALLKLSGVADVELDPRSTDWGRARIGPTRIDLTGGLGKTSRFIVQLATATGRAASTGELYPLNRMQSILREIQGHLSPTTGLAADILTGRTFSGEEVNLSKATIKKQLWNRLVPGFIQDMTDAVRQQGAMGAVTALPAVAGATVMSYRTPYDKKRDLQDEIAQANRFDDYGSMVDEIGGQKAQALIEADSRYQGVEDEIVEYRRTRGSERGMSDIAREFETEQETDDTALGKGQITFEDWRNSYTERQKLLGAHYAEYLAANPKIAERVAKEREGADAFHLSTDASPDAVRSAYFSLFDPYKGQTGLITAEEWEKLGADIDRFRAHITPAQQKALDENLAAGKSDTIQRYREDMATIRPYWDLNDSMWTIFCMKNPQYKTFAGFSYTDVKKALETKYTAQGKAASWVDQDPLVKAFESYARPRREEFLIKNPQVDALRAVWGYTDRVHSKVAEAIYAGKAGKIPQMVKP